MQDVIRREASRRAFLKTAVIVGSAAVVPGCASRIVKTAAAPVIPVPPPPVRVEAPKVAAAPKTPLGVRPEMFRAALASLERHKPMLRDASRIAIADFRAPSSQPRFHLVNLHDGSATSLLVAHGMGSDPSHTGFLQRFSNEVNSEASCEGAFLASNYYVGKHGRSQRLIGLDPTNSNALERAIVVHGAWYANQDMIPQHGKLGRSQGCFAVGEASLQTVFDALGEGRMIYAAKA